MLIDSTDDPFAAEIRYHEKCWATYANRKGTSDNTHIENVHLGEAQEIVFSRVQKVVFGEHEIRTLQGLLVDYKVIIGNYGFSTDSIKSSSLKEILQREFVDDTSAGGSYMEAVIRSIGISNEQAIRNAASRLKRQVVSNPTVPWPSHVAELEQEEEVSDLLLHLLTWLKDPSSTKMDINPITRTLASLLTKYITGKRTICSINLTVTMNGLAKNKELVNVLHKDVIGISYADVLLMLDFSAANDFTLSPFCPFEIADGVPAITIVGIDNFKIDSLSGNAACAHRTNVMYVQPQSIEKHIQVNGKRIKDATVM